MNAERLRAVCGWILKEHDEIETLDRLGELVEVSSGTDALRPEDVVGSLVKDIRERASREYSWRDVLSELGVADSVGEGLAQEIESVLRNGLRTDELKSLIARVETVISTARKLDVGFESFRVPSANLAPGTVEVGIRIPRFREGMRPSRLAEDLNDLDDLFVSYNEVIKGTREPVSVSTIASSEFMFFVEAYAPVALAVAVTVERLVALYEKLLNVRKLRNEAKELSSATRARVEKDIRQEKTVAIDDEVNSVMRRRASSVENDRMGQLAAELREAIRKLSDKIDRGYGIEVQPERGVGEDSGTIHHLIDIANRGALRVNEPIAQEEEVEGSAGENAGESG